MWSYIASGPRIKVQYKVVQMYTIPHTQAKLCDLITCVYEAVLK